MEYHVERQKITSERRKAIYTEYLNYIDTLSLKYKRLVLQKATTEEIAHIPYITLHDNVYNLQNRAKGSHYMISWWSVALFGYK